MAPSTKPKAAPEPASDIPDLPLDRLRTLPTFQQEHPRTFPSLDALRWLIRKHKTRLVEGGALLVIAGRLWIDPPVFSQVVMEVGREEALKEAA